MFSEGYFLGRYATERLQVQQATYLQEISGSVFHLQEIINGKYQEETVKCDCDEPIVKLKCNYSNVTAKVGEDVKHALNDLHLCFR